MKKILRILSLVFLYLLILFGCPACTYTRNAPLINHNAPIIQTSLDVKDSANGNTVTPVP